MKSLAALAKVFAPLEKVEKGLGEAVRLQVAGGGHESVLLRLAGLNDPVKQAHLSTVAAGMWSGLARIWTECEGWDAALVLRLGEVLAQLLPRLLGTGAVPGTPGRADAVGALAGFGARALAEHRPPPAPSTWLLTGPRCRELLGLSGADTGASAEALVDILFSGLYSSVHDPRQALLAMEGLAEVLAVQPERALQAARALDAEGAFCFLVWLGRSGLAAQPAFLTFLFQTVAGPGRRRADAALGALRCAEAGIVCQEARRLFASPQSGERAGAVRVLAALGTPEAGALLAAHLPGEKAARVREEIEHALRSLAAAAGESSADADDSTGYLAISGERIARAPPAPNSSDTPLPPGFQAQLREAVAEADREDRAAFVAHQRQWAAWTEEERRYLQAPRHYSVAYDVRAVADVVRVIDGKVAPRKASAAARKLVSAGGYPSVREQHNNRLQTLLEQPGVTRHHLARLLALQMGEIEANYSHHLHWAAAILTPYPWCAPAVLLHRQAAAQGDWRGVLAVCAPCGGDATVLLGWLLSETGRWVWYGLGRPVRRLLRDAVADHLFLIDQALGLVPAPAAGASLSRTAALEMLSLLPSAPRRHQPLLLTLAVSGGPDERPLARALLASAPDLRSQIEPLLASGEQDRRIGAARWLRERNERESIPALRAALAKEKTDLARAVFLSALTALGDDVSDQFEEGALLAQAREGLSKTKSQVGRCVALDHLPALTWADGSPVPAEVVRWWVVLADKVKTPRGHPLLNLALDRLAPAGAAQLSMLLLSSFVTFDTRQPTEAEANAHADSQADSLAQTVQQWQPDFTREQAFAQLKNQKLREYLHSAHDHRGILALARCAPAAEAVAVVRSYFRDHYPRLAQCKDLLDALANHPSPLALQCVLGISMRHRTRAVQQHAQALVASIAAERGWTADELADRSIPACGLDERGTLTLTTGGGAYEARLTSGLDVILRNPQGRPVKSLPSGTDEAGREAKKALSQLKKALKETVSQQTARLYESMCAGRVWKSADFESLLLRHPVAGRLCQRLVLAGVSADGRVLGCFRALEDGSLTDAADGEVQLATFAGVRIAHRVLLEDGAADAWRQHLKDYEVAGLFEQLARPVLMPTEGQGGARSIREREGHMLDTFTLRGAADRLGYLRGPAADGGWFNSYRRPFGSLGLAAIVEFTGSGMQQTNIPAALLELRFERLGEEAGHPLPLEEVPPVLLSEAWNDLRTIAAAGPGFDPEWRTKARGG